MQLVCDLTFFIMCSVVEGGGLNFLSFWLSSTNLLSNNNTACRFWALVACHHVAPLHFSPVLLVHQVGGSYPTRFKIFLTENISNRRGLTHIHTYTHKESESERQTDWRTDRHRHRHRVFSTRDLSCRLGYWEVRDLTNSYFDIFSCHRSIYRSWRSTGICRSHCC